MIGRPTEFGLGNWVPKKKKGGKGIELKMAAGCRVGRGKKMATALTGEEIKG